MPTSRALTSDNINTLSVEREARTSAPCLGLAVAIAGALWAGLGSALFLLA